MSNKQGYMNVEDVAQKAALSALREFKKEEKRNRKKTILHNTGLLMSNYLDLMEHYETIKYRASDLEEEEFEGLNFENATQDDIIIQSIKRSKVRTMIIISQINTAVKLLETAMKDRNEIEKLEAFKRLYMAPDKKDLKFSTRVIDVTKEMTACGIPCSESSVRRWSNEMLNELSVKLFGVDGLRIDI